MHNFRVYTRTFERFWNSNLAGSLLFVRYTRRSGRTVFSNHLSGLLFSITGFRCPRTLTRSSTSMIMGGTLALVQGDLTLINTDSARDARETLDRLEDMARDRFELFHERIWYVSPNLYTAPSKSG